MLLLSDERQESPLLTNLTVNSVQNSPAAVSVGEQNGRWRAVHYSAETQKSVLNVYLGVYLVRVFEKNGFSFMLLKEKKKSHFGDTCFSLHRDDLHLDLI